MEIAEPTGVRVDEVAVRQLPLQDSCRRFCKGALVPGIPAAIEPGPDVDGADERYDDGSRHAAVSRCSRPRAVTQAQPRPAGTDRRVDFRHAGGASTTAAFMLSTQERRAGTRYSRRA